MADDSPTRTPRRTAGGLRSPRGGTTYAAQVRDAPSGAVRKHQASRTPLPNEAGTPPEDRAFRPDIQGLRAIAVLLVVFTHAGVGFFSSGYIGVDVFFVISGFVITGLLLRDTSLTGHIHLAHFYGRRAIRILPAALFVASVAVVAEAVLVGHSAAADAAQYGRSATLFLGNFPIIGTPVGGVASPFGAYWSLAVEEQFYLVYPVLVIMSIHLIRPWPARMKLGLLLIMSVAASLSYSIVISPGAFFFTYLFTPTRIWELAVGGLVAVAGNWTTSIPRGVATSLSWLGLAAIFAAAHSLSAAHGGYPGYIALWPVLATAAVIVGGSPAPPYGSEWLLMRWPFKWLGLWSFSIYLWHYPILVLVATRWGPTSVWSKLGLMVLAVAISAGTYFAIENPVRHSDYLTRSSWRSIIFGGCLIGACFVMLTIVAASSMITIHG